MTSRSQRRFSSAIAVCIFSGILLTIFYRFRQWWPSQGIVLAFWWRDWGMLWEMSARVGDSVVIRINHFPNKALLLCSHVRSGKVKKARKTKKFKSGNVVWRNIAVLARNDMIYMVCFKLQFGWDPVEVRSIHHTFTYKQYTEQHNETEYTAQNMQNNKNT
jgi:hypothetical protein